MASDKPTLVLLGTPDFAVPAFRTLFESGRYNIPAVITQPDKPSGRGLELQPPPVKVLAQEFGAAVFQPPSLKGLSLETGPETAKILRGSTTTGDQLAGELNALGTIDLFIVVAYGKIIPQALLDTSRLGALNIHGSLLPRWRGAAPIQRAIFAGDLVSGVALMKLEAGLDTGPVYCREQVPLEDNETFGTLHDKLAALGSKLLRESLDRILEGAMTPQPQPDTGITYAEKWEKEDCEIRWDEPAAVISRRVRACSPVPGARTLLENTAVKIYSLTLHPRGAFAPAAPGTIVEVNRGGIVVACGEEEYISLEELQFAGKKRMSAEAVVLGRQVAIGQRFLALSGTAA